MVESAVQSSAEIVVGSDEKKLIRVLHVDDELGLLKVTKQCLKLQGPFQVDTAGSVEEALNKLKEKEYDAVVSDYQMPGKDGLEFLEMLRKNGNTIPFIMFTGKGREEVAVKAWNLGADHYVNKTGDPETVYCELAHCLRSTVEKHSAEAQMKETAQKLQTIYQNAVEGITYVDAEENIVYANKAFADLIGYKQDQLAGMNLRRIVNDENWAKIRNETRRRRQGESNRFEVKLRRSGGTVRNAQVSGAPLLDHDNRFAGTIGIVLDITERKKAEETLRESEKKYHSLYSLMSEGVAIHEVTYDGLGKAVDYVILDVNPSFESITGIKKEKAVGSKASELYETGKPPYLEIFAEVAASGKPTSFETYFPPMRKHFCISVFSPARGKFATVFYDITERKRSEELLRELEERSRSLFESIQDPVGIFVGKEGRLVDYNVAFKRSSGYTDEELKGKIFSDFVHPDDRAMVLEKYQTEYSEEEFPLVYEIRGMNKGGESLPLEISVSPYKKKGRAIGIEVIHRDITERKRYERSLSALNSYGGDLNMAESMKEIYRLTLDAMQKVLGFEYADFFMIDKSALCIVDQRGYPEPFPLELPLDGSKKGISTKVAKTGNSVIVQDVRKNTDFVEGLPGILSELAVPIKVGEKTLGVLNVESKELNGFDEKDQELLEILASHAVTAISNLDRARELEAYAREIRESQQMFERLFTDNPEAAVHTDSSFHILNINPRFSKLFGYSLDEVKGKHINDIVVPKDKIREAVAFDEKASKGKTYHEDTVRKRKDGSLVPVALSAAPIIVENQVIGHIAAYKDISQLKKAEDDLKESLHKLDTMNEKLRVVGGLTRHDVRNKLSTITGNTYLLKKQLTGNSEALDKLGEMETAVQQTVKIFDFAKTYEMLGVEELVYNDVEKTVNEAISLFTNHNNIKVINDCHGLTVLADSLLRQLFYNLIDNSLKHGQKTARIRVCYEKADQDWLKLVYEDDGIGIPAAEKPKLFRKGYSTRGSTGYGLYLIKKTMEVYGWAISETGTPGKGVRFTMVIPEKNQSGKENYRLH